MTMFDGFLNSISNNYSLVSCEEINTKFSCNYTLDDFKSPSQEDLDKVFLLVNGSDNLSVKFDIDGVEVLFNSDCDHLIDKITSVMELVDPDPFFEIKFIINKNFINQFSIYSEANILDFWKSGSIKDIFYRIEDLLQKNNKIKFNKRVFFLGDSCDYQPESTINKLCKMSGYENLTLLPKNLVILDGIKSNIDNFFLKIRQILTIMYLCDFIEFNSKGYMHLTLNGYRSFNKEVRFFSDLDSIDFDEEIYQIYKWVYSGQESLEKIGIARNIISLHISSGDLLKIDRGSWNSVKTGYKIYQKDNVKQYIDIKSRLSDSVIDSSNKASLIANNLGINFRNSVWTIYSFFISVLIIRVLSNSSERLITGEVYGIFMLLIFLVFIYMIFTLREIDNEKVRFESNYTNLKSRYLDIIEQGDINNMLDNDKQHNSDLAYIHDKVIHYKLLWIYSLLIAFIIVTCIWAYHT